MLEQLKAVVVKLLKVPPEPAVPAGSPGSARTFRAALNYFKLKLCLWGFQQLFGLLGILAFLAVWPSVSREMPREVVLTVDVLKFIGVLTFLVQIPITYALVRLDYEMRWYIATDRSLRIRAGLWRVQEMTMTFANIQQITVHQGPLQRLLKIYDLEVSTAGGGVPVHYGHTGGQQNNDAHRGFFHGIDNAPEIRDMMLERLRRLRDTGLGDPDERHPAEPSETAASSPLLEAARELLREAQSLRRAGV